MRKKLGMLTMFVEYPKEDGSMGRRGLKVQLNSAPLERWAGDRREEVLGLTFEALASLLGVPGVRVTVDNERDLLRVLADAPRAQENLGDVFETCPDSTCGDHPQGCPRMRAKIPFGDLDKGEYDLSPTPAQEVTRGVTPGMEMVDLGKCAYEAYKAKTGGVSAVSGEPLPEWDALAVPVREAWVASAIAVQPALIRMPSCATCELRLAELDALRNCTCSASTPPADVTALMEPVVVCPAHQNLSAVKQRLGR